MNKVLSILVMFLIVAGAAVFAAGEQEASEDRAYTIATVVKVDEIAWFDRLREGVEAFGAETGHDTFLLGPSQADAAQQVRIVEDLIAQGVDAITIVPLANI